MAEARLPDEMSGVNAKIKVGVGEEGALVVLPTKTFNVKDTTDKFDATNPTSAGWKKSGSAARQFSGSFEAFVIRGSAPVSLQSGMVYAMETDRGDEYGWTFDALVSDVDHKYDGKGEQSYTGTFESYGAVTPKVPAGP